MSSDRAAGDGGATASEGDRVLELFGLEVVIEEDFLTFPWRAGVARGPVAFLVTYAFVALLSAVATVGAGASVIDVVLMLAVVVALGYVLRSLVGLGGAATRSDLANHAAALLVVVVVLAFAGWARRVPFVDRVAILGIVTYNAHTVPAVTALVPQALAPVAGTVGDLPVLGRGLGGLFAVGRGHAAPVAHLLDIASGKTGTIGHVNLLEQQATRVPTLLYYLVPVAVLAGAGYEFARSAWDRAATDTPVEMARFGLAVGVGYVATMLVGTVVLTYRGASPLRPGVVFTVMPDRYLTVIFGFVYPAVLVSLGALAVYVQGGPDAEGSGRDDPDVEGSGRDDPDVDG